MPASPYTLYSLSGHHLHIVYVGPQVEPSGPVGDEYFLYQDRHGAHEFKGKDIHIVGSDLGLIVSVIIRLTIDSGSTTFSLLVPRVGLPGQAAVPVRNEGITTLHR